VVRQADRHVDRDDLEATSAAKVGATHTRPVVALAPSSTIGRR
jgi:hypothetical protein